MAFALKLLGGFELRDPGGNPVPLSSGKARALLAFLAIRPGQAVSRQKAAALLWGDRGDEQALGSLRQTLSVLRKALDDATGEILLATTAELSVNGEKLRTDTATFEDLALSGGREDLQRAVELYEGPLLDGFGIREAPFEDWLRGERGRFADLATGAISALLGQCEADGDCDTAVSLATRILKIDPLREDIHRVLMQLHRRTGNWNEALRQYQDCKALLEAELGVPPQEETRALYDEIMAERGKGGAPEPAAAAVRPEASLLQEDGRPSIAVMPFESLGSDPEQGYFSDGVTEDIITELSRFPGLIVIARNSTFAYKDRPFAPQDISREFGVQYVVTGSVRKLGDRMRLSAQLIEAGTGKQVWAERYDRNLTDVFELQDELTRGIVAVLPGRIENFEARKVVRKLPEVMAAYELLLAGKIHHHRFEKGECIRALELLDRAIALAPDYAAAHAWKACVLGQALGRGFLPDPQSLFNGASEAVGIALRLDENEVEAHRIQAEIAMETKNLARAEYHNGRALTLNPNDPRLLAQKGELLTWQGKAGDGIEWIRMAMRLDPYSAPMWAHLLGRALMMSGAYEEAGDAYLKSSFPRPGYHADAAGCYARLGRDAETAAQVAEALRMKPDFSVESYISGLAWDNEADRARHREILTGTALPG